ncbi:MAG TPA: class III extradiol dioxygenase subunit B-like domain-containing protein [Micromonosporaceae bacterium]|nr:class III extradiol dioxygenase subunit B-like domain-containing protein [Micromonosporaceae bacterium]
MPLVAAAVCPQPPLLVPEVAAGAAIELADLRTRCDGAVAGLVAARPELIIAIGADGATGRCPPPYGGSLAPWGLHRTVGSPGGALPLGLLIGAWLLSRCAAAKAVPVAYQAVGASAGPDECAALGAALAGEAERVALLVMGDGSACRGEDAPGSADDRAGPFDAAVAAALRDGDPDALLGLDPVLADELMAAGRPAWQVLGGAGASRRWRAELSYAAAPYGVGYFVAGWS